MDEDTQSSQTLFPHETGHHRSARERQRKGPMWGCLKTIFWLAVGLFVFFFLIIGGGWWYIGSSSFADLIAKRIAETLSSRLGRTVTIAKVEIVRTHPQKVIINDLRISNSPGAVNPDFATVRRIEIAGGIDSFWGRQIKVDRVEILAPHLFFEIYPAGSPLTHNFPHWQPAKKGRYEIYHMQIGKLFVGGGDFSFLDRRHNITADATGLAAETAINLAQGVYEGVATSPRVRVQIQDYVPFDLDLRGGFRYAPGILLLKSIALRAPGIEMFLSGKLDPLTEGVYDLKLGGDIGLNRVREIFKVQKTLDGRVTLDGNLRGKAGDFRLTGGWISSKIVADAYDLTSLKGRMNVTGDRAVVDVDSGRYGGGAISAHYVLPRYAEPYPMSVDLRYDHVSVEKLFGDWGIHDTGLRGAATGKLTYGWNKDRVLAGAGSGTATLSKDPVAFSNAKYPIPVGGSTDFALNNGVVTFLRGELNTDASQIDLTGTLRIEDVFTNLDVKVHSSDFSELDRAAYNFAHSAGKETYTLLGLGGAGDITATVRGPIKEADVVAHITGSAVKYNNVLLGEADIDLTYEGPRSLLTFKRAVFRDGNGRLVLTGTVAFPDRAPSPSFDLAVDATNYPVERVIAAVDLKLKLHGLGTGKLLVTGTKDAGKVTFLGLMIHEKNAELRLTGDVTWAPGTGNVRFNLDIAAKSFPVADIAAFLDIANLPLTGDLTGTLHLEGPKNSLEGRGSVTVRNGSVQGEQVDVATADIAFTQGTLHATSVNVTSPAGQVTGEAEFNFSTNHFSYMISSSSVDVSKLKILSTLNNLFGGTLKITSSGGGTLDQPELVVEATLTEAAIRGLALPPDAPPPTLYVAIRNGQLIIRGSAANVLSIDGSGTVGEDYSVDGAVRITISDIAKLVALSPNTATVPAAGNAVIDLRLGGKLSSLEALRIDGSIPTLDLRVADHQFTAARPLRFGVRDGRFTFDDFQLQAAESTFALSGFAELTGSKRLAVRMRGRLESALLQLFVHDLHADGHIDLAADVSGTMSDPRINGSAELQGAQFRFEGFPQLIDNVTGTLLFRGDRIDIDSLRATVGGGTIVAGGSVTVQGLKPKGARISLQGTNVAIRYFEGLTVEGNFSLFASGDAERILLQGDVAVTRALYFKDFNFQTSLLNVLLSRRGVTPVVAANWQDRVSLRIHLTAPPDTLAVRNNIADVTGNAEIDVTGTLSNPVVLGLVTLNEGGRVRFQNLDYNVVRGSINFQNPFRIDPYFDITLEGRVSGGVQELESGPVDVTVNLVGTLDRFTPTVTSDPPASDITLFSLLGVGGLFSQTSGSPTPNAGAALAGRSLIYQSLGSLLGSKILPFVDNFTIDPGLLETSGDPGPKATFERRLSNNIRLFVIYSLHDAKTRAVLEWQVNNDWTLQFTRDEIRKEYRAEARFRRRYKGHWTFSGNRRPVTMFAALSPVEGSISDLPPQPEKALSPGAVPPTGPVVTEITYRADSRFDTSVLGQYVALRVGQPLSIRAMQSTIKSLFATGDFRDVRIETTPNGNGVAVTLLLFVNYRVPDISFDGLPGSLRDRAERVLTVHIGDVLSLNAVDRSASAVQDLLARLGYLEAAVDPETTFVRQTSRANVVFHVTTGPRAKVSAVQIEGNIAPFTPGELIKQMRHGPGSHFSIADARSDAERTAAYLYRRDHRKAEVRYLSETYDAATQTVLLRYSANAGPIVRVQVKGVPRSAVRGLIPFKKNQGYSEDLIDTAAEAIVKHYQEHGYFNATVDTEGKLEDNVWTTIFHVAPGERYQLAAVTFSGNQKIPDQKLRQVITTSPRGGIRELLATLFRRPTGVTRAQLSADRDAIESYYRLQGFSEATVGTAVVSTDAARHTMKADFPIVEGPQTLVSTVSIEGNEQVPSKDLPKTLLKPGDPLNPAVLRSDLIALQTFYSDRGNAEAQITPRVDPTPDKTLAKVSYVIAEGPKIKVDQVIVRGNTYTNSTTILRKSGIDKGEAFSYRSILEAQRNLYSLGIFQRVDIQPELATTPVADRNITISVEEGKNLTASGSVGLTSQTGQALSLLGSASIAHRNLFGTGRYLGLQIIAAGRQRQEAFLTYREPFVFGYDLPVQLTVFQSDEFRPRAHIQQRGTFIEAAKVARFETRWSARYEYKISDCLEDPKNLADLCTYVREVVFPGLDRSITNVKISSFTPAFFWDRRDDSIDPHRGFFTSASAEYAFPIFSADAKFMKEFAQAAYYLPVTQRSVFAISGRIGLIQPLGPRDSMGERTGVPLSERFTAGGETSHRAFRLDLLGRTCPEPDPEKPEENMNCKATLVQLIVNGTRAGGPIAALGGNALFIANAEYRFPVFSSVYGAVFVDVGNVYADNFIDLSDLRYGAGTGIRYISPIGPLRFDVGFNPRRRIIGLTEQGDPLREDRYVYFITLGHAF